RASKKTPPQAVTSTEERDMSLVTPAPAVPPQPAGTPTPATPAAPPFEAHRARLRELLALHAASAQTPRRRRGRQPTPLQGLQETIRREAVHCYHGLRDQGQTLDAC